MKKGGFGLIGVLVVGLAAAFALGILDWGYWKSRVSREARLAAHSINSSGRHESPEVARSNAAICRENLRQIELAKRKAAQASGLTKSAVTWQEILPHLGNRRPVCPSGGSYDIGSTTVFAKCSVSNNRTTDEADDHILKAF
jgi:hypothetical protein